MAVYPDSVHLEYYDPYGSGWNNDFTHDVISPIKVTYGIPGNKPIDRVASSGRMTFTMRNDAGNLLHSEGGWIPSTPEWNFGTKVRLRIVTDGVSHSRFVGYITAFKPDVMNKRLEVTVSDWFEFAARYQATTTDVFLDMTFEEIVNVVERDMTIQPTTTDYDTGTVTFPVSFDMLDRGKYNGLTEIQKAAMSEFGWVYLRQDWQNGDTLRAENREYRKGRQISKFNILPSEEDNWVDESGNYIVDQNGNHLVWDSTADAEYTNDEFDLKATWGDSVTNYIDVKSYSKRVADYGLVYRSTTPIYFGAGETKVITVKYQDPNGQASSAYLWYLAVTPSYIANTSADGTGTDKSAFYSSTNSLTAYEATLTITNSGTASYLTKLELYGWGSFTDEATSNVSQDATSISTYGQNSYSLEMKYAPLSTFPSDIADKILAWMKDPRYSVSSVSFHANYDHKLMEAFLYGDIGDLIHLVDTKSSLDDYFNIQNVQFTVSQGKIIDFTWELVPNFEANDTSWLLGVAGRSELGVTTYVGY